MKKTALNSLHHSLHAKMVDFGGWEMPVEYSGIVQEHQAVRTAVGMFDVSHMGEIDIQGQEALALVQHVTSNDAAKLADGQIQYAGLMTPDGTFVDDLLVHRIHSDHYFLCVNASNTDKDFNWIVSNNRFAAEVKNLSPQYTQLAIQGPRALSVLQALTATDLAAIKYYWFTFGKVDGVEALIARTGYTGEDGFEIYFDPSQSQQLWNRVMEAGRSAGIVPVGLGARNTLRLEASMALYGHEIDDTTTVFEANLGWICKLNKGEFLGREPLVRQKQEGVKRMLVGFEMVEPGIARDHYPVLIDGKPAGHVTSGSPAPFLKRNIGMAYVPVEHSRAGTPLQIQVRQRSVGAKIIPTPFYKRNR
ncbi:MAG: glycine cleavage system aminomethyltransferase GcvT [Acidobacteriia bacterium]|nr:glycine cleavage system aminomethyltransferase GcvT [Terriglobia bacterium]